MSEVQENSFIFYRSFYEAMEGLSDADRLSLYDAIVRLALDGECAPLPPSVRGLFILIKPQIEANIRKRIAGRTGGRPPKAKTNGYSETETNGCFDEKPNYNANENANIKDNADGVCKGLNGEGSGESKEGEAKNAPDYDAVQASWNRYLKAREDSGNPVKDTQERDKVFDRVKVLGGNDPAKYAAIIDRMTEAYKGR